MKEPQVGPNFCLDKPLLRCLQTLPLSSSSTTTKAELSFGVFMLSSWNFAILWKVNTLAEIILLWNPHVFGKKFDTTQFQFINFFLQKSALWVHDINVSKKKSYFKILLPLNPISPIRTVANSPEVTSCFYPWYFNISLRRGFNFFLKSPYGS